METQPEVCGARERRQYPRYRVGSETLAFLGKDAGVILDISQGGVAFHFAVFDHEPSLLGRLDIFSSEANFYLPSLPVHLVHETLTAPHSLFSTLRIKRLGMQFGELSHEQQGKLKDFFQRCATDEV